MEQGQDPRLNKIYIGSSSLSRSRQPSLALRDFNTVVSSSRNTWYGSGRYGTGKGAGLGVESTRSMPASCNSKPQRAAARKVHASLISHSSPRKMLPKETVVCSTSAKNIGNNPCTSQSIQCLSTVAVGIDTIHPGYCHVMLCNM